MEKLKKNPQSNASDHKSILLKETLCMKGITLCQILPSKQSYSYSPIVDALKKDFIEKEKAVMSRSNAWSGFGAHPMSHAGVWFNTLWSLMVFWQTINASLIDKHVMFNQVQLLVKH